MKIQGHLGHQILKVFAFPLESVNLLAIGILCGVATQALFACLYELFGQRAEVVGFDTFTTIQFVDCDLATKALRGLCGSSLLQCTSCEWLNEPAEQIVECPGFVLQLPGFCLGCCGSRALLPRGHLIPLSGARSTYK